MILADRLRLPHDRQYKGPHCPLAEKRNVSGNTRAVITEFQPKVLFEQTIFGSNTNFGSDDERHRTSHPHRPPCICGGGRHQHAEHGGIDRVPNPAIRAGLNQVVISADSRFKSPLLAQFMRGCPS